MKCKTNKNDLQNASLGLNVPLELLDFKDVLEHFRRLAGIPKNQLARLVGCPYANFKRICNPDEDYYPSVMTVLSLDEVFQEHLGITPLTEWQARQLGKTLVNLEEHPMVPETTPEHDACCAMAEASILIGNTAQALEDGKIQPEEAQTLLAILESTQRSLAQLKEKLKKLLEVEINEKL